MDAENTTEQFVQQLAAQQNRIYGYIFSLLGSHARASDVLQETNLVLWRRLTDFDPQRPFTPWALAIARMQVLSSLRDQNRDRLLLDADLVEQVSANVEQQVSLVDEYGEALRTCLNSLSDRNRELIELKYFRNQSLADIASRVDRTTGAVKVALLRARQQLLQCVQKRIGATE